MMKIKVDIPETLKRAIDKSPLIIGIGPSAWPRVVSGFYFPKFKIICFNDCQDNELIREAGIEVFSQKEVDPMAEITPITPGNIITTDLAKKFLAEIKEPFSFLIYKSMGKFEKVCKENGWKFIGNTMEIKDKYEDKRIFKEIIKKIGIEAIPGDNMPIKDLTREVVAKYQKAFGQKKLVLQIAEATWGGGSGTLFIDGPDGADKLKARAAEIKKALTKKKKQIETVNIAPFIDGVSCSISCCATKYGTLSGSIQTQLVDIPEVGGNLPTRSGVFVGHDWGFRDFDENTQSQATAIARKFGDFMYKNGYRGIFGLDLIVDNNGKVWPVECNPRETDAFPLICMLQMQEGVVPMQVFHNLEHLGVEYEIDFEEVDRGYKRKYAASQMLIYNKSPEFQMDRNTLKAGVYKVDGEKIIFVRPGFAVWDLEGEDEFLITEDVSKKPGVVYDPHERMLRVIKKGSVLEKDAVLKKNVARFVDWVYREMRLVEIEFGLKDKRGLKVLFSKKLIQAKKSDDLKKADVVNVLKNTGGGFYRPMSISWRRKLDLKKDVIEQIPSKRGRKQIRMDSKKIAGLGISIRTIDEISRTDFEKWYGLYKKIISEKEKGEVMIDYDWLDKKIAAGKRVGAIIAERDGKIIGGDLFFEVNKRLGVGYGVAQRIPELYGGLTLLLDYYFLEYAKEHGYEEVTFGQDTNIYGYDLSKGLISYKEKLGFYPVPANKTYWVSTYFQSLKKFPEGVSFYAGNEDALGLVEVSDTKTKLIYEKKD